MGKDGGRVPKTVREHHGVVYVLHIAHVVQLYSILFLEPRSLPFTHLFTKLHNMAIPQNGIRLVILCHLETLIR